MSTIVTKQVHEEEESVFTNKSTRLLIDWQNTSSSAKSNNEITHLVHNVILHPDFWLDKVQIFNAAWENQNADMAKAKSPVLQGFQYTDIQINIPSGDKDLNSSLFTIPGLYFHKLTMLIKDTFESPLSSMFHFTPFKMYHTQPDGTNEHVFSEIYDSDIFWEEHSRVQLAPTDNLTCKWEKVITALVTASLMATPSSNLSVQVGSLRDEQEVCEVP